MDTGNSIRLFSKTKRKIKDDSKSSDDNREVKPRKQATTAEIQKEQEEHLKEEFKKIVPRQLAKGVFPIEQTEFEELHIKRWLANTCRILEMKYATDVQKCCIPNILNGKSVIAVAQTGSGKTATYALPILQTLSIEPFGVYALVLTPTRELAYQVGHQFHALSHSMELRFSVICGGLSIHNQCLALARRPHIIIATPGRLASLLENDLDLKMIFRRMKYLILDEADMLLDTKYENELRHILSQIPTERQTLLFSATMTENLINLQKKVLKDAYIYQAYEGSRTVSTLKQEYAFVPLNVKDVYLYYLLQTISMNSAIIFCNNSYNCRLLSYMLSNLGMDIAYMYGDMSQNKRISNLDKFKSQWVNILVATDLASRGLDIPSVDLIINYEIPKIPKTYVHRVGRTARAGRTGRAISFVCKHDIENLKNIEEFIDVKMNEYVMNENEVLARMKNVYDAKTKAIIVIKKEEYIKKNRK